MPKKQFPQERCAFRKCTKKAPKPCRVKVSNKDLPNQVVPPYSGKKLGPKTSCAAVQCQKVATAKTSWTAAESPKSSLRTKLSRLPVAKKNRRREHHVAPGREAQTNTCILTASEHMLPNLDLHAAQQLPRHARLVGCGKWAYILSWEKRLS